MNKQKLILLISVVAGSVLISATILFIYKDIKKENLSKYIFEMNLKCEEQYLKSCDKLYEAGDEVVERKKVFYSYKQNSCILREDYSTKEFITKQLINLNTLDVIETYNSECVPNSGCDDLGKFFKIENNLRKY